MQPSHHSASSGPNVRKRAHQGRRRGGWFIITLGLVAASAALFKLEFPRLFDKVVPQGIYKDVPPVSGLHPELAAASKELARLAKAAGISVVFTDGFRSPAEQDELYARGRTTDGSVVTHAQGGESFHNYGLAIDFALENRKGDYIWDMEYDGNRNGKADWMEVVTIAKKLGFSWGGDWPDFKDNPHLQMDFGYSIREMQQGNRPPGSLLADGGETKEE